MSDRLYDESLAARLDHLAATQAAHYRANRPFPHIVIDDFLPAEVLQDIVREFPSPQGLAWTVFDNREERKLAFNRIECLPASLREVLQFMNSVRMLRFLESLTGIENLIADPYYVGGGLHQVCRGGHLAVHLDFNKDERFDFDRRLNMIIYLNQSWPEEYGGHLELWDERMEQCRQRIAPLFNRCVVFSTSEKSYHGHPQALACPEDRTRQSLATYYYTNGRSGVVSAPAHSTIFKDRPEDRSLRRLVYRIAAQLTPPIVRTVQRKLRRR